MRHKKFAQTLFVFDEVKIAVKTFVFMLLPVFISIIVLEIFIPKEALMENIKTHIKTTTDMNMKIHILYLISASAHYIISFIVILYYSQKLFENITNEKKDQIIKGFAILTVFLTILLFIFDGLQVNLALLSHERLYSILRDTYFYSEYFKLIVCFTHLQFFSFYLFSFIPFTLIFLGLAIIVLTCLNIGKDLKRVLNKLEKRLSKNERKEVLAQIHDFHSYIYILSAVLVTSTIATILFFLLPVPCVLDQAIAENFKNVSYSMGISWGVIFSLTMLTMCLYPYAFLRIKLKTLITNNEIIEDEDYLCWLQKIKDNYLIYNNLRTLISALAPVLVSLIPKLI